MLWMKREIGKVVRANHAKWREVLIGEGLDNKYMDVLVHSLQGLIA